MLIFGLSVSLIGMGTVLFALVLLMGIIKAIGLFTTLAERITVLEGKKEAEGLSSGHVMTPPVQAENDREIAVVIAAALAAFLRKS